jgi:hypothetical protein
LEWGGGATPFSLLDLENRDAISIPTAPTNPFHSTALNFLFANKMRLANN